LVAAFYLLHMQPQDRIAINTGYLYARMAITVFISLYATRLVLGALGANDFGIFNLVGGAIAMLTFLNTSMAAATQRFMSFALGARNSDRQKSIFNVSIILHFMIAILVVLALEGVGAFLFNGILKIEPDKIEVAKWIFQFMLIDTFFTIVSVPYDAIINANENMLLVTILGILESVLKLAIAIYITKTPYGKLMTYGLLTASLSVLLLIIRRVYCHVVYEEAVINFNKFYDKSLLKEMTSFAGWNLLGSSTSMVASYGQGIVMNVFFGTIANAAQGIAAQISGQLGAFSTTMMLALNPVIDKSEGAGNRSLMIKASVVGSKVSFFLLMFFYVPFLIETPFILKLWLKNVPAFVVIFCRLLLLRNLIEQLFITLTSSISAVGNIKRFQIFSSILFILPLLVTYYLYYLHYPVYTLYVIFLLFAVVKSVNILYFSFLSFNLSFKFFLERVIFRCLSAFGLIFILTFIPFFILNTGFVRLSVVCITNVVSFFIVVLFVGFTNNERIEFITIFKQLINKMQLNKRRAYQAITKTNGR